MYTSTEFSQGWKEPSIQWRKNSLQQMVLEDLDICMEKNDNGPYFTQYTKINQKWIKGLNGRLKNYKNSYRYLGGKKS